MKKTLVLGASPNPDRYSYLALNKLLRYGHEVVAVGNKESVVNGVEITKEKKDFGKVDTVTLYMRAANQKEYYDYIFSLNPKRIIYNPGAENYELMKMANEKGVENIEGCTLVMLSTNQY